MDNHGMNGVRPWIAYVGPVAFPEGGAAARRILGNAKALVAIGYDVVIVSGQPPGTAGTSFDVAPGIRCISVNERNAEHLPKALRYARYALMGSRSRRWLDAQPVSPAAVILYSGYSPYLLQLTGWARRRGVALLFDAVEWYTAASFWHFLVSPYLWNTECAMRVLIPRLDGVIAISRALEAYYSGRGLPVKRVPPLFDASEIAPTHPATDPLRRLRLAYSGTPGRKDLLDVVISAVIACDGNAGRLVLDIAGISAAEVLQSASIQAIGGILPSCINVHGVVTHERSLELVGQADFTVFLRQIDRVSTCGFPTKFIESMALGTPVITNLTSDMNDHLRNGETGFVCSKPTKTELELVLTEAMSLTPKARHQYRIAARTEAERSFNYTKYVDTLDNLIKTSQQNVKKKRFKK